ncbi:hypothetical protein SEA_LITTLEFELLA_3 [Gordonia phage LittleFella]|nr:hypothetical protein SEA_LITTLEFELLA_3 [Gordonia phage LittleFella]
MAAWGNALGGYRRQRRDRKGRFTSSGRAAKATYKAAKRKNAKAHRSRLTGSVKARGRELARPGNRRTRNIVGGAAAYGVGRSIGSASIQSRGANMMRYGVSANYGRTTATRKMSKGLQKSQNRKARNQYRKAIGSTRTTRALRNGIVTAGVAGLSYAAYKNGNIKAGQTAKGTYFVGAVKGSQGVRIGGAMGSKSGARIFAEAFPGGKRPSVYAGLNATNGGVLAYTHKGRRVLR